MPGFSDAFPNRPVQGFSPGARLHGLTSPLQAQVDEGDLVGRWYLLATTFCNNRGIGPNPTIGVSPNPFVTYSTVGAAFAFGGDGTKGPIVNLNSNALLGGVGGYQPNVTDYIDPRKLPVYTAYIKTGPDITNVRMWIGMYSGGTITQNNDDPGFPGGADTNFAGFRFSAGVDGGFVGCCRNAVGAVFSVTPTIKPVAASTEYQFRVRILSATLVGFQIDGEPEVFITGATCPDWTNGTNRFLNTMVSHINKTASTHTTGFQGDMVYLAG